MTPAPKTTFTIALIAALVGICNCAAAQTLPTRGSGNTECSAKFNTQSNTQSNACKTLAETLVVSTPDAVWVKDEHPLITLTEGSLIVIAGRLPATIKTTAADVYIPAGLAAMVQQENNHSVRISMIGVRGKVADPDRNQWAVTVKTTNDAGYRLRFGDVLSISSDDGSNTAVIQQPPAARKLIREAAHQLNSIALALNVNGVLLADKIANDCASVLLTLAQGSTVSSAKLPNHPVKIFIDDGTKFIAVQPDSIYAPAAFHPASSDAMLVATRKK